MSDQNRIAVVTGLHPHDVIGFQDLFDELEGVHPYIQHMEDFVCSPEQVRDDYGCVVFYHFHMDTPTGTEESWCAKPTKSAIEHLGTSSQGVVVLHHALLAFPDWEVWTRITGLPERKQFGYSPGENLKVRVASTDHPITRGMSDWEMVEETYQLRQDPVDSEILLTAEHPKSMRCIGWTRRHGKSRVFCLQLGHDNQGWSHPSFRKVLGRGIDWASGRL